MWMMASPSVNGKIALLHASSDLEVRFRTSRVVLTMTILSTSSET